MSKEVKKTPPRSLGIAVKKAFVTVKKKKTAKKLTSLSGLNPSKKSSSD